MEENVDEKYYLSDRFIEQMTKYVKNYNRKDKFIGGVSDGDIVARTITTKLDRPESNYIAIPEATKQGYAEAQDGDGVYINRPHQKRGVVQKDKIQTIKTSVNDIGVVVDNPLRIRKLTPKECFRLMGVKDEDYEKLTCSNAQKYKQAGNSIVVDVLIEIFRGLI